MTAHPASLERERNPARSREAILDSAEALFADRGYNGTSLSEVGLRAGVSRGTPGYFFGSKAELYQAVLERCFGQAREAIRSGRDRALASGQSPEVVLAGAVAEYFDFFHANPNFVRLMEREALGGGPEHRGAQRPDLVHEATLAILEELGLDPSRSSEAAHLVLSIMGLCWFPLVHAHTVLPSLGFDALDDAFVQQRRQHVVDLVMKGARELRELKGLTERKASQAGNGSRPAPALR